MTTNFSPILVSSSIVQPLRYFFARFVSPDLIWTTDPNTTGIEIDTINNFNKIAIQEKPRILVSRGGYSFQPSGLSDNMSSGATSRQTGPRVECRILMVSGVAQVLIEARNEGTCEKVVGLAEDFLQQSGPMIAGYHHYKNFGVPLQVSTCVPSKENIEILTCTINVPWSREVMYTVTEEGKEFNQFLLSVTD